MLDVPGISVSVPATRPAVQDSAVAISRFLRLQMSSRRFAASTMSSSSIGRAPRQPHRRGGVGGDAFAAPGEAELLAGRRLDRDAGDLDAGKLRDARAHGVAVRADARSLAHDVDVDMRDAAAALFQAFDREGQETVGGGAAPLRI